MSKLNMHSLHEVASEQWLDVRCCTAVQKLPQQALVLIQCVVRRLSSNLCPHCWIARFYTADKELFEVGNKFISLHHRVEIIWPSAQSIGHNSFPSPPITNIKVESLKFINPSCQSLGRFDDRIHI